MTSWAWVGNQEGWEGFGVVGAPRRSECKIQGRRRSQQRSYALFLKIRWRVVTAAETQEYQDLVRRCSWVYFWTHPKQENIQVDTPPTKCRPWECVMMWGTVSVLSSLSIVFFPQDLPWHGHGLAACWRRLPRPCRALVRALQVASWSNAHCCSLGRLSREREDIPGGDYQGDFIE